MRSVRSIRWRLDRKWTRMIADKIRQENSRLRRTRILRNHMHAVSFFVEAVSNTVNMLRIPFDLHSHRAFENIADHRARMAMRRGRTARRIGHLDGRNLQVSRVESRQRV